MPPEEDNQQSPEATQQRTQVQELRRRQLETLLPEAYELKFETERKLNVTDNPTRRGELKLDLENIAKQIKDYEDEYGGPLPPLPKKLGLENERESGGSPPILHPSPKGGSGFNKPITISVLGVLALVVIATTLLMTVSTAGSKGVATPTPQPTATPVPPSEPTATPVPPSEPTVRIDQGMAIIGSDITPEPGHEAEFPKSSIELAAFEIDQFEVSNQNYKLCVTARACTEPSSEGINQFNDPSKKNHPVVGVDATQAAKYCNWRGKRLPTSLEWERAARGANGDNWPWGNSPNPTPGINVNFPSRISKGTVPVDQFKNDARKEKNGEIYDLVGNVSEWTASYPDWRKTWGESKGIFPNDNTYMVWNGPYGAVRSDDNNVTWELIIRGGSWSSGINQITHNDFTRAAQSYNDLGFRCVR